VSTVAELRFCHHVERQIIADGGDDLKNRVRVRGVKRSSVGGDHRGGRGDGDWSDVGWR
jgi:hypothetical protein